MPNTPDAARDALLGIVKAAWDANAGGALLMYDNLDGDRPDPPALFGRAVVRHYPGQYAALGNRRLRRIGTVFVQVFVPQNSAKTGQDSVSNAVLVALQVATSAQLDGIMLRDLGMVELGSDGVYDQTNVQADFQYDTNA